MLQSGYDYQNKDSFKNREQKSSLNKLKNTPMDDAMLLEQ